MARGHRLVSEFDACRLKHSRGRCSAPFLVWVVGLQSGLNRTTLDSLLPSVGGNNWVKHAIHPLSVPVAAVSPPDTIAHSPRDLCRAWRSRGPEPATLNGGMGGY